MVALGRLLPLDLEPVLESVARTGALVTVEEGTLTAGFGAEIAARVQSEAWDRLRGRCGASPRSTGSSRPRGRSSRPCCPDVADIVEAVLAVGRRADGCSRSSSRARTRTASRRCSSSGSPTTASSPQGPAGLRDRDVEVADRDRGARRRDPPASRPRRRGGRARQPDRRDRRDAAELAAPTRRDARRPRRRRAGRARERDAEGRRAGRAARDRPRHDREGRLHHRRGRRGPVAERARGGGGRGAGPLAGISLEGV